MRETVLEAVLRSADAPSEAQRNRFAAFLKKQYGQEVPLRWEQDPALEKGFRMEVGADLYDWSLEGRLRQFRERLEQLNPTGVSVIPLMREAVHNWQPDTAPEEVGSVLTVGDEIATVSGLEPAAYGEILQFSSGVKGMVQDLRPDRVGCILFGGSEAIESGSIVRRTGKTAGIPVGDGFLGRVVDALGTPIDGQGDIPSEGYLPIESPAPGIIDRQPVNAPMETGLLAIDSMFPIGRGQRELIIGDRQTGKTAIALDTVLNQKGKGVVCIYVAIGQKSSSVAQLVENLRHKGAMDYTIVVNAPASASASLQYIAPYAGTALGEYFMRKGRDVLIVYDDLSKHAVAYRTLSLLLERSSRTGGLPRRCVLSALPSAGAFRPSLGGIGRRQHDGAAHRGDPGRRCVRLHPHQYHFHYRRPDLSGEQSVLLRPAARGQRGIVGVPCGRRRSDEGHEKGGRRPASGSGPVPGNGGLYPVFQ